MELALLNAVATSPRIPAFLETTGISHVTVYCHDPHHSQPAARWIPLYHGVTHLCCEGGVFPTSLPASLREFEFHPQCDGVLETAELERTKVVLRSLAHTPYLQRLTLSLTPGALKLPAHLGKMLPPSLQQVHVCTNLTIIDFDTMVEDGYFWPGVIDLACFGKAAGFQGHLFLTIYAESSEMGDSELESLLLPGLRAIAPIHSLTFWGHECDTTSSDDEEDDDDEYKSLLQAMAACARVFRS